MKRLIAIFIFLFLLILSTPANAGWFDNESTDVEGTAVLSTGEAGGTKFLREDGDGTSSWQEAAGGSGDLLADGTIPLTADWDAGNFDLTMKNLVVSGTVDGIDIATDVAANTTKTTESTTAGRSLTLSTFSVSADAELYTDQTGVWIEDPAVEAMDDMFVGFMNAITITYIKCKTDAGTVEINLEDGADANILSAELVCDVGGQTSCSSGCDVNTLQNTAITALTEDIDLDISAVATATRLSLMVGFTLDD